jgi:hypothetical protein
MRIRFGAEKNRHHVGWNTPELWLDDSCMHLGEELSMDPQDEQQQLFPAATSEDDNNYP